MPHPAPVQPKKPAIIPCQKIKLKKVIMHILRLPDEQRIIIYSQDESFRIWDLERGTQVGEEWEDKERGVRSIALSPGGKTMASGNMDLTVKLWNVDTGKVIKTLTGHRREVRSVYWSSDGGRVVSGSRDETFRVWDVKSGETILGPINAGIDNVDAVCYSPNAKMIVTGGKMGLKIWDANTGELLKTFEIGLTMYTMCLAWTSDGKTLFAGESKIDTVTWTVLVKRKNISNTISLSPNERIFASTKYLDKTARLWNLKTNQPIGTPLRHERDVKSATFSADGKFLITSCLDHLYTWDISAIVEEAGLPSDIVDVTSRPVPKMKGAPRIPPGFFDDGLREVNLRIGLSKSQGLHNHTTPAPRQRTLSRFSSFWRPSKPHGATEGEQSRARPFSRARNLVSGMLRRQDRSDIQLREVEVPYTAGKPRNYHAGKKKPAASSSRPPNTHATQQHSGAAQSTPSSSQQPPSTTAASTLSAVTGAAGTTGTLLHPHITVAGWRARLVGWLCCMPIQNTNCQH